MHACSLHRVFYFHTPCLAATSFTAALSRTAYMEPNATKARQRLDDFDDQLELPAGTADDLLSGLKLPFPLTEAKILQQRLHTLNGNALVFACLRAVPDETEFPLVSFYKAGGYNVIFVAAFPSGREIVARVPLVAAPEVVASTVATMSYARHCMGIPCPAILAWNDSPSNPIRSPYILMEKIEGECLADMWDSLRSDEAMDMDEKIGALHALSGLYVQMTKRLGDFNAYGSLFFDEETSVDDLSDPRCYAVRSLVCSKPFDKRKLNVSWSAPPSLDIREIWRHAYDTIWAAMRERWGPGTSEEENIEVIGIDTWDEAEAAARDLSVLIDTVEIPASLMSPSLVHWDFALRNVMYDRHRRKITSVLDWDDVAVLPAVLLPHFPEEFHVAAPHSRMAGDWSLISSQPNGWYSDHQSERTEHDIEISLQYSHLASSLREADNARYKQLFLQQLRLYGFDQAHLPIHPGCRLCIDSPVCSDAMDIHRLLNVGYVYWCEERRWLAKRVQDLRSEPPAPLQNGHTKPEPRPLGHAWFFGIKGAVSRYMHWPRFP